MFREVQAKEQRGERKLDVEEARIEMLKKDFLDEYNRTRSTNRNWRAQIGPHLFPPTFFIFPRKVIAVLFFFPLSFFAFFSLFALSFDLSPFVQRSNKA